MYIRIRSIIGLLFLLFSFSSCTFISQSIKSDEQKMMDLENLVSQVQKIYAWQDFNKLVPMIDGLPNEIMRKIAKAYKNVKFHEVSIDEVTFKEGVERAYSTLEIKSFHASEAVVESHIDQIEWVFKPIEGGWRIKSISVGEAKKLD